MACAAGRMAMHTHALSSPAGGTWNAPETCDSDSRAALPTARRCTGGESDSDMRLGQPRSGCAADGRADSGMRLGQPRSGFATAVLTRTCDSDSRAPVALPTAPPLRARGRRQRTSRSGVRLGKVRGGSAELAVLPAAKKSRLCQRPAAIAAARCHGGQGTEAGWAIRRWWRSLRWDRCSRAGPNRRRRTRCYKLTSLLANNSTLPVPGRRRGR